MKNNIEKKLDSLLKLQAIDCELDNITKTRGVLPEEVADLEDELDRLQTHSQSTQEELLNLQQEISTQRTRIKEIEALVKKYEEQQMNVRNNREYDAITKEIDLQKLEIKLTEKHIKGAYEQIEKKKLDLEEKKIAIEKNRQLFADKQRELEVLIKESEGEEKKLNEQRDKLLQHIDVHLQQTYEQIRANVRNKLAVVTINREACGGCFNQLPPQKQLEIEERNSIILCEYCGRIIAGITELSIEESYQKSI